MGLQSAQDAAQKQGFHFGAVKLDETCPTKDQSAPAQVAGKMPDFNRSHRPGRS
jgi:hypothetical protein